MGLGRSWEQTASSPSGVLGGHGVGRRVHYAAQGLVVLGPKLMVKAIPVLITPERLTQWHAQALAVWQEMWWNEIGETPVRMNWEACTDKRHHWGKECLYLPACHDLAGNESVFGGVYRRIGDMR